MKYQDGSLACENLTLFISHICSLYSENFINIVVHSLVQNAFLSKVITRCDMYIFLFLQVILEPIGLHSQNGIAQQHSIH